MAQATDHLQTVHCAYCLEYLFFVITRFFTLYNWLPQSHSIVLLLDGSHAHRHGNNQSEYMFAEVATCKSLLSMMENSHEQIFLAKMFVKSI